MAAEVGRRALIQYNVHRRVVHFTWGKLPNVAEIRHIFSDVLPPAAASPPHLVIQMKQEEWGGEFVDANENESLPDKSILEYILVVTLILLSSRLYTRGHQRARNCKR